MLSEIVVLLLCEFIEIPIKKTKEKKASYCENSFFRNQQQIIFSEIVCEFIELYSVKSLVN